MHDLATRIRDHYESAADPVTVDEIFAAARPDTTLQQAHMRPTPAPADSRRRLVAVAAATAVLILVGGTALIFRQTGTDSPVAPVATVPPIGSVSSLSWSRVPHDEVVFGDKVPFTNKMADVTVGGPGLVAVGHRDGGSAVWTSVDGITWSRVPFDAAVFGGSNRMLSVTTGGPGLVAVGDRVGGGSAVWTSVDGITWSRVPYDEAVFGGENRMLSVTTGGPGLVAVGGPHLWGGPADDGDAAVWTSVDGFTWSRVPRDDAVFGGEGQQTMNSVTVGGPGLVAVGHGDDGAAVWTSVDGITWSRVPHDEAVFGGEDLQIMRSVTVGGPGLVAVGSDESSAAVWTSVDGITWSRVPHDDAVFGGEHDQAMNSVTAAGPGVVAVGRAWQLDVGSHSLGLDDSAASVWTSEDGITWTWLGYDEAVFGSVENFMSSLIATDWGVVAVGADWSGPSYGAAVWVAQTEN